MWLGPSVSQNSSHLLNASSSPLGRDVLMVCSVSPMAPNFYKNYAQSGSCFVNDQPSARLASTYSLAACLTCSTPPASPWLFS